MSAEVHARLGRMKKRRLTRRRVIDSYTRTSDSVQSVASAMIRPVKLFAVARLLLLACALLLCARPAEAQRSDCAIVTTDGDRVTLTANSWDPVLAIGRTLADRYGIAVSVETPKWTFPSDTESVAIADPEWSAQHRNAHYLVMKRHLLQVRFSSRGDWVPNVDALVRQIVDAANREMPYAYRVDAQGKNYVLVPTKTVN